jgi:hypothetical protein
MLRIYSCSTAAAIEVEVEVMDFAIDMDIQRVVRYSRTDTFRGQWPRL